VWGLDRQEISGFTGILNLETIGAPSSRRICASPYQWPDLYGAGWTAFVGFIAMGLGATPMPIAARLQIVLCGPWGRRYRHPRAALAQEVAHAGGLERADHLPTRQGAGAGIPCPRAVSACDRQCLRSGEKGRRRASVAQDISWAQSLPFNSQARR